MIIIFAACFCGYGFVFNDGALGINGGYSIVIAIYLYIIGAGIRKYDIGKNIKSRYLIITYIMCAIINSGAVIVLMWLGRGGLAWRMFAYNNPLIVIEAISLFIIFTKIGKEGRISLSIGKLGKYTLAVYLIHSNPLVTTYRFIPVQQYIEKNGIWVMPMSIIIYSIILFMACICIEIIRSKITKLIIKCKR